VKQAVRAPVPEPSADPPAYPEPPRRSDFPENPCLDLATYKDETECWWAATDDINDVLHGVLASERQSPADSGSASALLKGQRAWERQRDASCRAAAESNKGGSLAQLTMVMCRYQANRRRLLEFKAAQAID